MGQGRVAVLSSDNIWLWSKGGEQAGPYTELLRNTAHWLMKEPELEEDYIRATLRGRTITVAQRDTSTASKSVHMRDPSGGESDVALSEHDGGWIKGVVQAAENGIYAFESGDKRATIAHAGGEG